MIESLSLQASAQTPTHAPTQAPSQGLSTVCLKTPHALQACWSAQLSGLDADVLNVALTMGVFKHLIRFIDVDALAHRLRLQVSSTTYLVELLWSAQVLERSTDEAGSLLYRLDTRLAAYLDPESVQYCGDALLHRHRVLRQVGEQFQTALLTGEPARCDADSAALQSGWAHAAQTQIGQEQRAITVDIATAIITGQESFDKSARMLDLGAGPGLVAIALAQTRPELSVVVFEYPAVAAVARGNVEKVNLADRIQVCEGDLVTDDFGSDYDLIWCSSVLHFVPDVQNLLVRIYKALAPGGLLISCHAEIDQDPDKARSVLQYYLGLRMQGRFVPYQGQLVHMLEQTGFRITDQLDHVPFPVAPVSVLVASRG